MPKSFFANFGVIVIASVLLIACSSANIRYLNRDTVIVQTDDAFASHETPSKRIRELANEGCTRFNKTPEYVSASHSEYYHDYLFLCR